MILALATSSPTPTAHVVHMDGVLTAVTYPALEKELQRLIGEGAKLIVLDVKGLTFLASTGIRVLLQTLKAMRAHGGELRLMQVPAQIQDVLDLVQLFPADTNFANAADLERFVKAGRG
ncbi:MAG: STAS domain-containing protein [Burkholderiales bacterium]|nr:STAS domain-containing protein [Opitutaceae bacterium]